MEINQECLKTNGMNGDSRVDSGQPVHSLTTFEIRTSMEKKTPKIFNWIWNPEHRDFCVQKIFNTRKVFELLSSKKNICAEGATSSECKWVSVPEVLFNRVVKRIWDLVTANFRYLAVDFAGWQAFWVSENGTRRPPDRAWFCPCVRHRICCSPVLDQVDGAEQCKYAKKVGQKEASVVSICTELDHFFASPLLTSPDINLFRLVCLAWGATCPAVSMSAVRIYLTKVLTRISVVLHWFPLIFNGKHDKSSRKIFEFEKNKK